MGKFISVKEQEELIRLDYRRLDLWQKLGQILGRAVGPNNSIKASDNVEWGELSSELEEVMAAIYKIMGGNRPK